MFISSAYHSAFGVNIQLLLPCLSDRYEKEGQPSQLSPVDIFVSTVDPLKEPPLVTANTVLSILAVDYPVDKVSCYVSDDGAAMLTFEALSETSEFARKWVPFCKKFNIEPRAPEWYFAQKIDYLKDKVLPSFVRERRAMKVTSFLLSKFFDVILCTSHSNSFAYQNFRENMKSLRSGLILWLPRHKRYRKKGGRCKMGLHGLGIMSATILA